MGKRITWLDYAKVFVMFLVVLGHTYKFASPPCYVRNLIYSFHMPFFFVVSGILWKDRGAGNALAGGVRTLLIPAFAWITIYICGECLITATNPLPIIGDCAKSILRGASFPCGVTWFLFVLFYCQVSTSVLCDIKRGRAILIASFLLLIAIAKCVPYLFVGNALMMLPFFWIGYYGKARFLNEHLARSVSVLIALLTGIIVVSFAFFFGPGSARAMAFGNVWTHPLPRPLNVPVYYFVAMCGTIFVLSMFRLLAFRRRVWVETLSSGLIVVLCAHAVICYGLFASFVEGRFPESPFTGVGLLVRLGIAAAVFLGCAGVNQLVCRYRFLSALNGFRTRK